MNNLYTICCICVRQNGALHYLHSASFDNVTYYEKLVTSFPDMAFDEKSAQYKICRQCCRDINLVYEFHKKCVAGKVEFSSLESQVFNKQNTNNINNNTNLTNEFHVIKEEYLQNQIFNNQESLVENVANSYKMENKLKCELNDSDAENIYVDTCTQAIAEVTKFQDVVNSNLLQCDVVESLQCTPEINNFSLPQESPPQINNAVINVNQTNDIDNDSQSYQCEICEKKFIHQILLDKHKILHQNIKPNQCDICLKSFSNKSYLTRHKPIHNLKNRHKCDECEKTYFTRAHLKQHKLCHTGVKPYECDVCSKKFVASSHLFRHRKIHNNTKLYQCEFCLKSFSCRNYLNNHKLLHSGLKPFACVICNKAYIHKAHLSQHMKEIHTKQKLFTCDTCGKSFPRNSSLNRHKKMHVEHEIKDIPPLKLNLDDLEKSVL